MGISPATLHRLEMAGQNVTLKTLEQIVGRLKCSISELFSEK
jgi:DNA-binding Xre family transcriptional regulator